LANRGRRRNLKELRGVKVLRGGHEWEQHKQGNGDRKQVMLGVDRLDMIKGIPQKILAFEKFLEENPLWRDKALQTGVY
ncbi:unnamed protein product, partial [Linum tenue]